MNRNARINFYQVEKCGYFGRGDDVSQFGDLTPTIQSLYDWISQDRPTIRETMTFNHTQGSDLLPVYCFDIQCSDDGSDYILTTWNETEIVDGQMASIRADEPTGEASVDVTVVNEGSIAGFPTYFWFVPDRNLLATICFEGNRLNGHRGMNAYLRGYLATAAPWVVVDDSVDSRRQILGYRPQENAEITKHVFPFFQSRPVRIPGQVDYIKNNREQIIKVFRKAEYSLSEIQPNSILRNMLVGLGIRSALRPIRNTRCTYSLKYCPTRVELDEIVGRWEDAIDTQWDDVGFQIKGVRGTKWLSHSVAKQEREFNITLCNEVVVDAGTLLRAIVANRNALLRAARA